MKLSKIMMLGVAGGLAAGSPLVGCDAETSDGGTNSATGQAMETGTGTDGANSSSTSSIESGATGDEGEAPSTTTSGATTPDTSDAGGPATSDTTTDSTTGDTSGLPTDGYDAVYASVTSVQTAGRKGTFTFSVGVFSPDTGCEQYANWWEVVSEEGELIGRRILTHSHVAPRWPQPFVRTTPIQLPSDQTVIVRAHMNTSGFGYRGYRGSVDVGFEPFETEPDFAEDLESVPPQPGECPF